MRPPSDMPRRSSGKRRLRLPSGRGRVVLIVALVLLFVLATSLRGIAGFYTDYLWFDSLDLSSVWRGVLGAKVSLVVIFTLVFFALMWVNLTLAERLSGRTVRFGGSSEDELVLRYRELVGRRSLLIRGATAGLLAIIAGSGTSSQWNNWILFTNHTDFGAEDATFGVDIGFYVFQLPFLRFVASWFFSALIVVLVATVVAHYLNGGIRMQASRDRVSSQVKAHVSVLLALLALVRAGQYLLDRYELVFSGRGPVDGATYTDVNVQERAILLLIMISVFATILFIVNIWRRGWVLPAMAVGLWALVAVLAGEAVPSFVQRFRVPPQEAALERPYIENNIEATRFALGLDQIDERPLEVNYDLTGEDLVENAETVNNIRLWDTAQLQRTFQRFQAVRDFYDVPDVDVDRYVIQDGPQEGSVQQVMVASRQIDDANLPSDTWEASRLVYTAGYGVIMAPANAKTSNGQPSLVERDIPIETDEGYPVVEQPDLYFGEDLEGYKIVDTTRGELRIEEGGQETTEANYDGADGVPLDSAWRQAAYALRFGEIEPLTSGSITADSKLLMRRDVRERVESLAPFLAFDHDPYPVVIDGRIVYVIDGYTTTDRYPNAQTVDAGRDIPEGSGLEGRSFNYARNSIKAVVDAYEGTVEMYVNEPDDPLIQAYQDAFPDLFTPVDEAPADLQFHFRYPEDLYRVQTSMWGRYHVSDPTEFLEGQNRWTVAPEPDTDVADTTTTTSPPATGAGAGEAPPVPEGQAGIDPTYQLLSEPGTADAEEQFVLVRPFTRADRPQLSAYMTATPEGELVSYNVGGEDSPQGPGGAADIMNQSDRVGQLRVIFGQSAEISFGNVLLVPIDGAIIYVRPVYVTSSNDAPLIKAVIVSYQDGQDSTQVEVQSTLADALEALFPGSPGTLEAEPDPEDDLDALDPGVAPGAGDSDPEPDDGDDPPEDDPATTQGLDATDAELLARLEEAFDAADAALADGDPVTHAERLQEAEEIARELIARTVDPDAADGEGGGTPTSTEPGGSGEPGAAGPTTTTEPPTTTTGPSA
ncbi:UPF0182 family protein [Iamia majanohamensis]|uniref:UPF0182 family protein n=1 Tax=Iamia majanohamensis TaxID=467976 RepID=A0AAE9Y899_9ACTN|nr:UPF0182 family protein [Iamia majanohamensis]WCO67561.1 UPF0182 family protein [Iamia majanohamensis]